jgi:hypothetical protein
MRGEPLLSFPDKRRARRFGGAIAECAPIPAERRWHIDLVQTIRKRDLLTHGWRMTHFPAGEARDERTGALLKLMGLERGWPDLLFCAPRSAVPLRVVAIPHGLELKKLGGVQTDEQVEVGNWFIMNGWPYRVADNIEDAWRVLQGWGALRLRVIT